MSMYNRLSNCKNQFQTPVKKVLCVCSAGLLRSPTTANVLHIKFGFNTRAVGANSEYALIAVDDVLLEWADEVVFMEQDHADAVFDKFPFWHGEFVVLGIPDMYEWDDPKLRSLIQQRYSESQINKGV